jgi:D-tyrosyl-tRNA(Tyr) deacylase
MRVVLQRVTRASVTIEGDIVGEIGAGLVVLLGVTHEDTERDIDYLVEKVTSLRIFQDQDEHMNLSLKDTGGAMLIVSQFTLYGDSRRGRRPSFSDAATPDLAERLYDKFVESARQTIQNVATGSFGKMMQVELVNDGPVTILLDSRKTF